MKELSNIKHTVTVRRRIKPTKAVREMILSDIQYRNKVWNAFVEEYYACINEQREFKPDKFKAWYFHNIEKPNHEYDVHSVGISEQVVKDIKRALKIAAYQNGKLHFKSTNPHSGSFKVHCKSRDTEYGTFNSRVYLNYKSFKYRIRGGQYIKIKFKNELTCDDGDVVGNTFYFINRRSHYIFSDLDVKEISFVYELGRFYACFSVDAYQEYDRNIHENYIRKENAGIDLGIRNPVCIWDGDKLTTYRLSQKQLNRISYLTRRYQRLQSIMDKKQYMSNNYKKVLKKYRITCRKIFNIRLDWRRKTCKEIATSYNRVCVDNYHVPTADKHIGMKRDLVRELNKYNRMHAMSYFIEYLKHACWKYGTDYYFSPEDTTRTCSICGFVNNNLSLAQRKLKCICCGSVIDRDQNAAQNCYNYLIYE
jgi:transposase